MECKAQFTDFMPRQILCDSLMSLIQNFKCTFSKVFKKSGSETLATTSRKSIRLGSQAGGPVPWRIRNQSCTVLQALRLCIAESAAPGHHHHVLPAPTKAGVLPSPPEGQVPGNGPHTLKTVGLPQQVKPLLRSLF